MIDILPRFIEGFPIAIKLLSWEGNPNQETVTKLKTIGINSLVFAPGANTPDTGDFLSIMQQNLENL